MKNTILALGVIFFFSLTLEAQEDYMPDNSLKEMEIYKSACYGTCPAYRITVYKNKVAIYKGMSNVEKEGVYLKNLSNKEYKTLCKAFKRSKFQDFDQDYYDKGIADAPITTLTYNAKSAGMKTIRRNLEWPDGLKDLETKMITLGKTDGWIKKQGKVTRDPGRKNIIENEIIVTLDKETDAEAWAKKYASYGVSLKKKISPRYSIWLIEFKTTQIDKEEFMDILDDDPSVKTAEFNAKLDPRK